MSFPFGFNFRQTSGYVTDGTNEYYNLGGAQTYPRTASGNTEGWASADSTGRDRSSSNDRRLAGICFVSTASNNVDYRVQLSTAGDWKVGLALGDQSSATVCSAAIYDSTTLKVTVVSAANTGAANSFYGANGTLYTHNNWVAANEGGDGSALVTLTFATTDFRVRMLPQTGGAPNCLAHVYLELVSAAAGSTRGTPIGNGGTAFNGGRTFQGIID